MDNSLGQQIKQDIKQIRQELLASGHNEDEIHNATFQRLGGKYGPELVEINMLELLEADDNYLDLYNVRDVVFDGAKLTESILKSSLVVIILILIGIGLSLIAKPS